MACYEDAVRVEELITGSIERKKFSSEFEDDFQEYRQRLMTEDDDQIASYVGSILHGKTLKNIYTDVHEKNPDGFSTEKFVAVMRFVKDILIARKRGDHHLVKTVELGEPISLADELTKELGTNFSPSSWTGASTARDRLLAVKSLVPVAQFAVEALIDTLETRQHNGGPPLDDCLDALESLRSLHKALGQLLNAADEGKLFADYNAGLATEAVGLINRIADALASDPLPYATCATIFGLLSACGFPSLGAFAAQVPLLGKRKRSS